MNVAALVKNLPQLKKAGTIIVNLSGFDDKNRRLANQITNPLEDGTLDSYRVYKIDITRLTRESLKETSLGRKAKDRCKNMFVLGFIYWMYNRELSSTLNFLNQKFAKKEDILDANTRVLKAGYHYGETTETFTTRYEIPPARMKAGTYRNIIGNQALALGLTAGARKAGIPLFYGSYPITPASDILHALAKYKRWGVTTFQAEDEIAAICSAIGASYGGSMGVTGSSGPGIALKGEALSLAAILELPLVVCNVQRAGPGTGMPTKTEQADLMQAIYGRHGECPLPVIAPKSPADCFHAALEAVQIALTFMTPVMLLSDGYIANGAEPWRFPKIQDLPTIKTNFAKPMENGEQFHPYTRDENLSRPWAVPGTKGLEHRIGGLEKEHITGNVSYNPENHQMMTKLRAQKVANIANFLPEQKIELGPEKGKLLVMGWGSTYGVIRSVVRELLEEGHEVSFTHLRSLNPFPRNLEQILRSYEHVLIPEINDGQLVHIIRSTFLINPKGFHKIKGQPIFKTELKDAVLSHLA